MTLKFVVNEDEQWGNIFNNGSGNGILGNVLDDKADFGIGCTFHMYTNFSLLKYFRRAIYVGICVTSPRSFISNL